MIDIYAVTDNVTDEQFDEAIEEAKAEENLRRANVIRKVARARMGESRTGLRRASSAVGILYTRKRERAPAKGGRSLTHEGAIYAPRIYLASPRLIAIKTEGHL